MTRNIDVQPARAQAVGLRAFEMCEHKGIGHPDTLMDGVCEAASRALSKRYLSASGRVLHHNLDKGLLVAGRSEPRFGGGRIVEPMRFLICGRATPLGSGMDVANLVADAAREYLHATIGLDVAPGDVATHIGSTSASLQQVFTAARVMPRANDTSFGTGFAPYSPLERCVLDVAHQLRAAAFKERFLAAGADFKVMGCRLGTKTTLTVAVAFIDRYVDGVAHYFALKQAMEQELVATLKLPGTLRINRLDEPQARDESGLHLTVTGLSGEMGDDGQVGRGNRVSGLITPGRAMSLEAAAGKNPVSHVGKLYNVLASLIARDIHAKVPGAEHVGVQLLSAIGEPIDRPELAGIEIHASDGVDASMRSLATEIADTWLADIQQVTGRILDGAIDLF
jgi:S-adenosylmethionine synthetase